MNPHLPGGLMPMMMPQQYMMAVRLPAGMPPPTHGQPIMAGAGVQAMQGLQGLPGALAQSQMLPAHLSHSPSPQSAGGLPVSVASTTSGSAASVSQAALMSMATSPIPGAQMPVGGSSLSGGLLSTSPYGFPLSAVSQGSMTMAGLAGSPMASHIAMAGAQIPGLSGAQMQTLPGAHPGPVAGMAAAAGYAQQAGLAGLTGAQLAGLSAQQMAGFPAAAAGYQPGYGNHIPGAAGLAGLQMAVPGPIPVQSASPPAAGPQIDSKKGVLAGLQVAGYGAEYQLQPPQTHTPSKTVDQDSTDDIVVLDDYNSDLHLVIDPDGYGAQPLSEPPGFCFCWAGARCTHGICRGKAYYEVKLIEELPVDFGEDHQETDPHILRIGWSLDSTSFQLGEEPNSYGFGGTGKFSDNNKFRNYGERFGVGDVIGCLLDLDSRAPNISYAKNGKWLGVAKPLAGYQIGNRDQALFPHILSKNVRFEVNFGQQAPWFPPAPGFMYIMQYPVTDRIRGLKPPTSKSSCEMIMIVGLPGAGKTTWGINKAKDNPEMKYNIIGTDTLIDKMRVMGLPRKKNYHGRWDVLIDKASKCLNKLFEIASKKKRNLILDQTNVYPSARRRKMKNFKGFIRRAAVMVPDDQELVRRSEKRTYEDGKYVPEEAVLDMKANFKLPLENDDNFDYIEYTDLPREKAVPLVEAYNREGQLKRPQAVRGGHGGQGDNRFKPPSDLKQTSTPQQGIQIKQQFPQMGGQGMPPLPPHRAPQPPPPPPPDQYQRDRRDRDLSNEPPEKRSRYDPSGGSALDFIKQEYSSGETDTSSDPSQALAGLQALQQFQDKKPEQSWQENFAAQLQQQQQHLAQFAGRGLIIGSAQLQFPPPQPGQGILGEYGSTQEQLRATAYGATPPGFAGFNPPVQIKQEQQQDTSTGQTGSTQWQTQGQSQWQNQNRNQNQGQTGFDRNKGQGQGDFNRNQRGQNYQQDSQGQNRGQGQSQRNQGNRQDSGNRPDSGFGMNRPNSGFGGNRQDSGFGGSRGIGNQPPKQQDQYNAPQSRSSFQPDQSRGQASQPGDNQRQGFGGQDNRGGRDNRNMGDNRQNMGGQPGFPGSGVGRFQDNQNQYGGFGGQNVPNQQQKEGESQDDDKPKRERRRPSKWDNPEENKDENQVSEAEAQQDFENALSNLRSKIANNQNEGPASDGQTNQPSSEKPQEQTSEMPSSESDSQGKQAMGGPPPGDMGMGPRPGFGPMGMGPRGPRGPPPFGPPGMMGGFRPRGPGMEGPPPFQGGRGGRGGFPDRGGRGGPPRPFRPRGDGGEGPRGPQGPPGGPPGGPGGPGWNPRGPGGPGPRGFNPRPGMGPGGPRGPPFQGPPGRFQRPPMGQRWQRPPR